MHLKDKSFFDVDLLDGKHASNTPNNVPVLDGSGKLPLAQLYLGSTVGTIAPGEHLHDDRYLQKTSYGNLTIKADNDNSSPTEYVDISAGLNTLRVQSNGGNKKNDNLLYNGFRVYHEGFKPDINNIGGTAGDRRFYTSVQGNNTNQDGWYTLFNILDIYSPSICLIRGYAHTSVMFVASRGYNGSGKLSILHSNLSSINGDYKYIKGLRLLRTGDVQIKLNGGSSVSVEAQIIGSSENLKLKPDLIKDDTDSPVIDVNLDGFKDNNIYINDTKVWHNGNTDEHVYQYFGIRNTYNNNGRGISLYGDYNGTGAPAYGLMFQGTGAFGKHGGVQGDWATYFTMGGSSNRGWIFKQGNGNGGNVASISSEGHIYGTKFVASSSGTQDNMLQNTSGGDVNLIFDRGPNANWRFKSSSGKLFIETDYTSSKTGYFPVITMEYNTGNVTVNKGYLKSTSFIAENNLNTDYQGITIKNTNTGNSAQSTLIFDSGSSNGKAGITLNGTGRTSNGVNSMTIFNNAGGNLNLQSTNKKVVLTNESYLVIEGGSANYNQGIRINRNSEDIANIVLGGPQGSSGTLEDGTWVIRRVNTGDFSIAHNSVTLGTGLSLHKDGQIKWRNRDIVLTDDPRLNNSRPANGGNADTVDGVHASSFVRTDQGNGCDIRLASADGRGLRFWDSDDFKIWMSSAGNGTWGGRLTGDTVSDYNMYFRMRGTNRGFVFSTNSGHAFGITDKGDIKARGNASIGDNKVEMKYNSTTESLDFVFN